MVLRGSNITLILRSFNILLRIESANVNVFHSHCEMNCRKVEDKVETVGKALENLFGRLV